MAFRDLDDIKDGTWGGILVIDPNGLRASDPGPHYYLLDTLSISPGLTDRSGNFIGTLNDNKNDVRVYDLELFHPSNTYILDNDEFWVGVQENSGSALPLSNTWDPVSGGRQWIMGGWISRRYWARPSRQIIATLEGIDYTSLWRDQPIGTDIRPHPYSESYPVDLAQLVITVLQDVNDLQSSNYEFTAHPTYFPKYANCTTDVLEHQNIVWVDDSSDLSAGEARIWDDKGSQTVTITSISHPVVYFFSNTGNPDGYLVSRNSKLIMASELTGVTWNREIKTDDAFSVMSIMCEQLDYEWQIMLNPPGASPAARRQVLFYPRGTGAPTNPPMIRFEHNIREAPVIQTGDITDLITEIITLNGENETIPPKTYMWVVPWFWQDVYVMSRRYSVASSPIPPNAVGGYSRYGDTTLIFDDDGQVAINFQRSEDGYFLVSSPYYSDDENGPPHPASILGLGMDLRKWRRLKFKFRHVTRVEPGSGTYYRILLCTHAHEAAWADPNAPVSQYYARAFQYQFGAQVQEVLGDSDDDTIDSSDWTLIDIKLPTVDEEGTITDLNGWVENYPNPAHTPAEAYLTADPLSIDFILFEVNCGESEPGYATGGGRKHLEVEYLTDATSSGEFYIRINKPEEVWGRGKNFPDTVTGETIFSHPNPSAYLGIGLQELVRIDAINGDYPDAASGSKYNVRLTHPIVNNYSAGTPLYLEGGFSWSLSQLRFEKNTFVEYSKSVVPTHLQNPKRYRVSSFTKAELVEEAKNNAEHELNVLGRSREKLEVLIDGDPRYLPGYLVSTALDGERWSDGYTDLVFHYSALMIDSAQFIVLNTDFYINLNLGILDTRVFEYTPSSVQSLQIPKIREHKTPVAGERRAI
jgi:hypothetical protein